MKQPIFTGSGVAIVTPMNSDSSINFDAFGKLIDFHLQNHTDAIIVCGTTGESSTMSDAEKLSAIEFVTKRVNGKIPVIAGTGSNDTQHALELSKQACDAGVDGLLIVTPYYNKTTQAGLVKHYEYIADRVNKPIILYNIPSRTGLCFAASTYKTLSAHPMINGIKEASGNFSLIAETRSLCGNDLFIWSGNDDQIVPIMSLGGKGVISTVANILPKETHDITEFALNGNFEKSSELLFKCLPVINNLFTEVNPIPVKQALNFMGFNAGSVRLPLCEMGTENANKLKSAMQKFGIIS